MGDPQDEETTVRKTVTIRARALNVACHRREAELAAWAGIALGVVGALSAWAVTVAVGG